MKIVVIGGTGLVGEKLVDRLRQGDDSVVKASPTHGVDTITGEGLEEALRDADVVVDVSNSPSLEGSDATEFFEASGRRLLAAGLAAGVRHHIALSIVGTDRLQGSGYFRGKRIQEDLIRASGIPFSILRSTQFFEFIAGVVQDGGTTMWRCRRRWCSRYRPSRSRGARRSRDRRGAERDDRAGRARPVPPSRPRRRGADGLRGRSAGHRGSARPLFRGRGVRAIPAACPRRARRRAPLR